MALLKNKDTGEKIILRAYHTFGRYKRTVDTCLVGKSVSQIHASIRWNGAQWFLSDQSRNGTWIDEHRLKAGQTKLLKVGSFIRFDKTDKLIWEVIDLAPPKTILFPIESDDSIIELSSFHALPDENRPEITIYLSEAGQWICESASECRALTDGDLITWCNKSWRFIQSEVVELTIDGEEQSILSVNEIDFQFHQNSNKRDVLLLINKRGETIDLGERVHHNLLLALAQQRLCDAKKESPLSQGWIMSEVLCNQLNIDEAHLNIQIFRARKQISQALSNAIHLPPVIERKTGYVRFGFPNFQIFRDSKLEKKQS